MKPKLISGLFMAIFAIACNQQQKQEGKNYKAVRDEVMQFHDLVMGSHSAVVKNQMRLDSLLKDMKGMKARFAKIDTLKEKEAIVTLISNLSNAENKMNDWMFAFEPDISGKSNQVAIQYFKNEKAKIAAIDSLYKNEISVSNVYLNKFKK